MPNLFDLSSNSMAEVITQLNSNPRTARTHSKTNGMQKSNAATAISSSTATVINPAATLPARFSAEAAGKNQMTVNAANDPLVASHFQDATSNFMTPPAYPFVNPDLASYAADAFVYSQLSDLNYRSDASSHYHHPTRMNPYARTSFYPMYTQREIHSPSQTAPDYS
jgi:hypothetical protein